MQSPESRVQWYRNETFIQPCTKHCPTSLTSFHLQHHISDTGNFYLLQVSSNFLARWSCAGSLRWISRKSLNFGSGLVKVWSSTSDRSLRFRVGAGVVSSSPSCLISLEIMSLEWSCVASHPESEIPSLNNAWCLRNAWYLGESSFDSVGSVKPGG